MTETHDTAAAKLIMLLEALAHVDTDNRVTASGDPEAPLTDDQLVRKFQRYTDFLGDRPGVDGADLLRDDGPRPLGEVVRAITEPVVPDLAAV